MESVFRNTLPRCCHYNTERYSTYRKHVVPVLYRTRDPLVEDLRSTTQCRTVQYSGIVDEVPNFAFVCCMYSRYRKLSSVCTINRHNVVRELEQQVMNELGRLGGNVVLALTTTTSAKESTEFGAVRGIVQGIEINFSSARL